MGAYRARAAESASIWWEAATRIINGGYTYYQEKERALAFPFLAHHLNSGDLFPGDLESPQ